MHTQTRSEWDRLVRALGAGVEPDGGGREVAHISGREVGYWDPRYAGVGIGVIHSDAPAQSEFSIQSA